MFRIIFFLLTVYIDFCMKQSKEHLNHSSAILEWFGSAVDTVCWDQRILPGETADTLIAGQVN